MRLFKAARQGTRDLTLLALLPLTLLFASSPLCAGEPMFEFHAPASAGDAANSAAVRDLAERLLPVYQEHDPDRYLANLSALQMVTGNYNAAYASRQTLRKRGRAADGGGPVARALVFDIYAYARSLQGEMHMTFADAFARSFRDVVPRLSDENAYAFSQWLDTSLPASRDTLQKTFDQQRAKDIIGQQEAVDLIWAYLQFDAYRAFGAQVGTLAAEDDHRRYDSNDQVLIATQGGAAISALVVRPRSSAKPLPALLEFTVYESGPNYAKECAAHGYVGVVAHTRGQTVPRSVVPYQHDGADASAVIDWIAKQSWSDGRVGMYGDGYSGFTPWAAAMRQPPALKAIAISASTAPGINFPMSGGIFQNSAYRWSSYVTNDDPARASSYYDDDLWRALDQKWYRSGRRYRDLGRLDQAANPPKANPIFIRWLNHPSYDRFWQTLIPYREQFAHINIPVFATTGYYAGSEPGVLYYFQQHSRFNPHADHTLLIGPYDDDALRRGPLAVLQGYPVDPAALIDLKELRYQWFDHVLKGAARPAVLADRVNYELMEANEWHHAASLDAMSRRPLRFYLTAAASGSHHRLTVQRVSHAAAIKQTVSLTDRKDAAWRPPNDIVSGALTTRNALMFVSAALSKATEVSGFFSGKLDFTVNKMDMDLNITLYELLPDGSYVHWFNPPYEFRASYAEDRVHRHLLKAGERQQLSFKSERLTSRLLRAGSRIVMVLGINKRPDREINYGTGNDVSEESIADGKIPLKVSWFGSSYIDVPARR